MKRVKNWTPQITRLVHNLTFATDSDVNAAIATKYRNYIFLYDDLTDQNACFQSVINEWSDYVNKLYQTTQYEYDPIENYNRYEQGTDLRTDNLNEATSLTANKTVNTTSSTSGSANTTQSSTTNDLTTTHKDAGYNSGSVPTVTAVDTQAGTVSGTGLETTSNQGTGNETTADTNTGSKANTGTQNNEHNWHIHGNIGVMSTQQMIEQERSIILDVLDFYIAKFADCFDIKGICKFSYNYDEELPDEE